MWFLTGWTKAVRLVTAIAGLIERFAGHEHSVRIFLERRFASALRGFHQRLDMPLKIRCPRDRLTIFFQAPYSTWQRDARHAVGPARSRKRRVRLVCGWRLGQRRNREEEQPCNPHALCLRQQCEPAVKHHRKVMLIALYTRMYSM
jgi:hypothetical protein